MATDSYIVMYRAAVTKTGEVLEGRVRISAKSKKYPGDIKAREAITKMLTLNHGAVHGLMLVDVDPLPDGVA